MTENKQKENLIDLQIKAAVLFIIALIISIILAYDKKLMLEDKDKIFSDKEAQNIALFQTLLVLIAASTFLFVAYNQYKISEKHHERDERDLFIQTETAALSVLAAIVGLYIVTKNYRGRTLEISEIETV